MFYRLLAVVLIFSLPGPPGPGTAGRYTPGVACAELAAAAPAAAGLAADTLRLMDTLIARAIRQRAMPGCQVLVARHGRVVWHRAYGYLTYDSLQPVSRHTWYDLASLTKVLATTPLVMHLVEQQQLHLYMPLAVYLPELSGTSKAAITLRQVLAHQGDLYPYLPFWQMALDSGLVPSGARPGVLNGPALKDSIVAWSARSPLFSEAVDSVNRPVYMYSDIGFILLQEIIERQTGKPLDLLADSLLYRPLRVRLMFNPLRQLPADSMAPTARDRHLRHRLLQGYVHDANTALLGGVGGQAGLFGRASDVAVLLQLFLQKGCYRGRRYFSRYTVRTFLSRPYPGNRRALGWDRPGPEPDGPVSELASDSTFGHSGFTGCSVWADPAENLIFVFLSNRVYPREDNQLLIDMNVRTRIQDLVYRAIIQPQTSK